jgi:hypothetical protein
MKRFAGLLETEAFIFIQNFYEFFRHTEFMYGTENRLNGVYIAKVELGSKPIEAITYKIHPSKRTSGSGRPLRIEMNDDS